MLNRIALTLLALLITPFVAANETQTADAAYSEGKQLYEIFACSSCHGAAGKDSLPGIPTLARQDETYLVNQLKDFQSGARNNGMSQSMIGYLKGVTDKEIRLLSKYLSQQ